MPKAIFKLPFNTSEGLDFNGYVLPYDTGETVPVKDNDGNDIVVPVMAGGFTILDNAPDTQTDIELRVQIECSQEVMNQLKTDPNYTWIEQLLEV